MRRSLTRILGRDTNLGATNDKLSCYVMHKHLIIDFDTLAREFEMDASPPKVIVGDFPEYKKELAIDMLFPYQSH